MAGFLGPDIDAMDLYNNVRSYFIERVIQNAFPKGFCAKHPFKSIRALDIMSYTRISAEFSLPSDSTLQKLPSPTEVIETLDASEHELTILENLLPMLSADTTKVT